jgi:hypothetical protein
MRAPSRGGLISTRWPRMRRPGEALETSSAEPLGDPAEPTADGWSYFVLTGLVVLVVVVVFFVAGGALTYLPAALSAA